MAGFDNWPVQGVGVLPTRSILQNVHVLGIEI